MSLGADADVVGDEDGAMSATPQSAAQLVFGSFVQLNLRAGVLVANGFADNALALAPAEAGGGGGVGDGGMHIPIGGGGGGVGAAGVRKVVMRECVFEVMFPLEYAAAASLAGLALREAAADATTLSRMRAASAAEHRANEEALKNHRGAPVMYDQRIQLRHAISGKFVTVRPRALSKARDARARGVGSIMERAA